MACCFFPSQLSSYLVDVDADVEAFRFPCTWWCYCCCGSSCCCCCCSCSWCCCCNRHGSLLRFILWLQQLLFQLLLILSIAPFWSWSMLPCACDEIEKQDGVTKYLHDRDSATFEQRACWHVRQKQMFSTTCLLHISKVCVVPEAHEEKTHRCWFSKHALAWSKASRNTTLQLARF